MNNKTWTLYMLRCGDGSLYTGVATDLQARLAKHRAGKGAKYTRGRLPLELVYSETSTDQGQALRRELEIKALSRQQKLALIGQGSA
ncbi:MAG: GIY-YIG nuclease family protein [Gammaproteobacteria bacterium SHHR-1]|uniref:GIY-YIG nuclease family protein n=1 Tax=Magnetovirga frankeli TaxID=947516 RepID=UPI00129366E6|nr:GIY-YIG nuclease family protein [gamma proteobacterium SS-5]